jgi:hypothetical protein
VSDFETDEADVKEAIENLLNKLYYSKNQKGIWGLLLLVT